MESQIDGGLEQDIFDFEEEESNKKGLEADFIKETYDYKTRFFIWDKSLAIQSPTWNMRDGQEIETYLMAQKYRQLFFLLVQR